MESWERAMRSQGTRHGLKIRNKTKGKDDTLPPPSTGVEENVEGYLNPYLNHPPIEPPQDEPDIHGRFAWKLMKM